jgi:hypothetical protein
MKVHPYLIIVDVDKIQEFIFESSRLKHIVGASVLIAYLTSRDFCFERKILEQGNEASDVGQLEDAGWMEIYFGGGNMKLLFAKKEEAERFLRSYQLQFAKTVESASFTSIIYKIDTGSAEKFEMGLEDADIELKKVKQGKEKIIYNYANPVFEICHFCEKRNAQMDLTLFNIDTDKPEMACRDCCKKDESQDKKNLETILKETLLARFMNRYYKEGKKFMNEFDDLKGDEGALLGIVTIDGNRFGEMIKNAVNDQISKSPTADEVNQYIHLLNRLSADINKKILAAMYQTLDDFKDKLTGRNKNILFRPIIIGGDDICFVMDGRRVIPFTEKLINALEEEDFWGYRLKFAAGVSIAKPNYPFFIAHQLSESLMKNVKKGNREFSGLDFEVIYTSSVENLEQMRKNKYEYKMDGKTYITTMRPYYFGDVDEKYKNFNTTLSIALGVENRGLLARNKIKQMRTLVRKGQVESEYEFRRMTGRMSREERNGIWKRLGMIYPTREKIWVDINGRLHNNFIDLSELNEFYPHKK